MIPAIAAALIAVSCDRTSQFEKDARTQLETTFKAIAVDPESVEISNIETKYLDDSLCIIHFDFTGRNTLGNSLTNREEYIYIKSCGKCYEALQNISDEGNVIFLNEERYNSRRIGKVYENLSYAEGLRYLAATFTNNYGKEAGSEKRSYFMIPVMGGTGAWETREYSNGSQYLLNEGDGTFSNAFVNDEPISAIFFVDADKSFSFKIMKDGSHVDKSQESYIFRIVDAEGRIKSVVLVNNPSDGLMTPTTSQSIEDMYAILSKGGIISVEATQRNPSGTPDVYKFTLNVEGFDKAFAQL